MLPPARDSEIALPNLSVPVTVKVPVDKFAVLVQITNESKSVLFANAPFKENSPAVLQAEDVTKQSS